MNAWTRGFTLIEMLIVIAIMSIFFMIALPSFKEMIAGQKVRMAASRLNSALILTRAEALKRNTSVTLAPEVAGQWNAGWKVVNPGDDTNLSTYGAVADITIAGPASVIYQGSGRVSGTDPASFKLSSSSTKTIRCVAVTLSGISTVTSSGC